MKIAFKTSDLVYLHIVCILSWSITHLTIVEPATVLRDVLGRGSADGVDDSTETGLNIARFSLHNQTCHPVTQPCRKELNLECSKTDENGRCRCSSGYLFVPHFGQCWKIPSIDQNTCEFDIECHAGNWGSNSRCMKSSGKCECWDYMGGGQVDTKFVDGVCYIQKSVGDPCNTNEECNYMIQGEAFCKLKNQKSRNSEISHKGTCECAENYVHSQRQGACLPYATKFGDKCSSPAQCQLGSLGRLSNCGNSGTCECYSPDGPTIYNYKNDKCYMLKEYNETCSSISECRASLGPRVECDFTEGYPNTKVCHCPTGKVCRSALPNTGVQTVFSLRSAWIGFLVLLLSTFMITFEMW